MLMVHVMDRKRNDNHNMAKSMIVGNWKMNTTVAEAEALAGGIASGVPDGLDVVVVVCPPFVSLVNVQVTLKDRDISVGAQDTHFEAERCSSQAKCLHKCS